MACFRPEVNDIALSKLCAWREKDRTRLVAGLSTGVLSLPAMPGRAGTIDNPSAPPGDEIVRRLAALPGRPRPGGA